MLRTLKDGTRLRFMVDGRHPQTVDRHGNTTAYGYDSQDRLLILTDPVGRITQFQHDTRGGWSRLWVPNEVRLLEVGWPFFPKQFQRYQLIDQFE
jgi:YD repeat-containing protein